MIKKVVVSMVLILFIANTHSSSPVNYESNWIVPRVYLHYDQTMNWGGSIFLFPINIDNQIGFKPVIETGLARNGGFAGIGGYVGYMDAQNGVSGYLMYGASKVWRSDDALLPVDWYVAPKIGLDLTCLNLELSHLSSNSNSELDAKLVFSIKLRMTEYCAESFVQIFGGYI